MGIDIVLQFGLLNGLTSCYSLLFFWLRFWESRITRRVVGTWFFELVIHYSILISCCA